jgi:hypothetical protein
MHVVRVEQTQEIWKAFVLFDAEQVAGTADAQRSQVGERRSWPQIDAQFRELGDDAGVTDAHEA